MVSLLLCLFRLTGILFQIIKYGIIYLLVIAVFVALLAIREYFFLAHLLVYIEKPSLQPPFSGHPCTSIVPSAAVFNGH